ncbi:hypothetical protein K466DRAFT_504633 [Polyporus arcularius HHB13444]|uniref:Uncharacterized protein n=1 Tax=Polyporus arcularius HHB13444 TaxID=1314778 RepID=A0A5C3NVG1_9APHY|nr:hypothetical protein K466DRAFT_504633 [Polyporus arcularius HHB13444]
MAELPVGGRPSELWLQNPAWIDGARNPPRIYSLLEEINADRVAVGYPPLLPGFVPVPFPGVPPIPHSTADTALVPPSQSVKTTGAEKGSDEPVERRIAIDGAGHLISVAVTYTPPSSTNTRSTRTAAKKAKEKHVKSDHIRLDIASRAEFIQAALAIHELDEQYRAGAHSGPAMKVWWTGSGGKSDAPTIDNDHDFEVTRTEIMKRNKTSTKVNIEFDLDGMEGYRVRKRVMSPSSARAHKLILSGIRSRGPRLDLFSEEEQLDGTMILQLKAKWPCARHQGEHGEPGHCYVDASGEHLGLNSRKLKLWAAAIRAADATKHHPPNTVEFDCLRDGRLNTAKARGRTGPNPPAASSSDMSSLVMAALLPLITNQLTAAAQGAVPLAAAQPAVSAPSTPRRRQAQPPAVPVSPSPAVGTELHTCIGDFLKAKGIDVSDAEPALADLELTPDIVNEVPIARLCDVMSCVEGRGRKFQVFCRDWAARVEDKRQRGL